MLVLSRLSRYNIGYIHYQFNYVLKPIKKPFKIKLNSNIAINGIQVCPNKDSINGQLYYEYYRLVEFVNETPHYESIMIRFRDNNEILIDNSMWNIFAKHQDNKIYHIQYAHFGIVNRVLDGKNNKYNIYTSIINTNLHTCDIFKKCVNDHIKTIDIYIHLRNTDQYFKLELENNDGIINKIQYTREYINRGIIITRTYIKE